MFYMIMSCLSWIDCLALYYVMNVLHWTADKMWLVMVVSSLLVSGQQFLRIRYKLTKMKSAENLKSERA